MFGVKGSQPTLSHEMAELFREADDLRRRAVDEAPRLRTEQDKQVDAARGRIERCVATMCHEAGE